MLGHSDFCIFAGLGLELVTPKLQIPDGLASRHSEFAALRGWFKTKLGILKQRRATHFRSVIAADFKQNQALVPILHTLAGMSPVWD